MPEIGSSGLISGDGKRGVGHRPQATAPILDFTIRDVTDLYPFGCQGRRDRLRFPAKRPRLSGATQARPMMAVGKSGGPIQLSYAKYGHTFRLFRVRMWLSFPLAELIF